MSCLAVHLSAQKITWAELADCRAHKHTLYGKREGRCTSCSVLFPFRNLTVDHAIPRARGATGHAGNRPLLCGVCNSLKGTGAQAEWLAKLRNRMA